MCNSISGNGNGCGAGGGGGEEWDHPCLKKQKYHHQHDKPRQRGLGVAKLEKILREQKDKEENKVAVAEFSSRLLSSLPRHYQPPSSTFLRPSPFMVTPFLYGNNAEVSSTGGGGGGNRVFGEPPPPQPTTAEAGCGCFPFPNSCEASLHGEGPHKDHPQLYKLHMNPSSSSLLSSTTAFSAGRNHQIEHPSNQRPCPDHCFIRPEEQKMAAGTKRPWPAFSNDKSSGLYYSPLLPADTQKAYHSPSCGHDSAVLLEPGKTVSREGNRSSSHLGFNSRRCLKESSSCDDHFLTLGPPGGGRGSHSPPRQTSNLLQFQGCLEGHHHQKASREGDMGSIETTLSLNYLIDELAEEDDHIDLDLKL